jgi:hypothetical protein
MSGILLLPDGDASHGEIFEVSTGIHFLPPLFVAFSSFFPTGHPKFVLYA